MSPENRKRFFLAGIAAVTLAAAFVAADYAGLFGIREKATTAFVEYRVKTLDAETGRTIGGVKLRCFQFGTNNACGQPASRKRGVVRFQIRMRKHMHESLLFTHKVWYSPVTEQELRIMYIHPDYQRRTQRFDITEMMKNPNQVFTVEMEPLIPAAERSGRQQPAAEQGSMADE